MSRRDVLRAGATAALLPPAQALAGAATSENFASARFSAEHLPFSRFGSYWAVSKLWTFGATEEIPADEWYVRLLEDDVTPNELFRVELYSGEKRLPVTGNLTPAKLTLSPDPGSALEFVIAEPDILRLRGKRCSLRLLCIKGSYGYAVERAANTWEILASVDLPRVQLRVLKGVLKVDARWADEPHAASCSSITIDLAPDQTGIFECLLRYYDALPRSDLHNLDFDEAATRVEREFSTWAGTLSALRPEYAKAQVVAAYVLWSNVVSARGLYRNPVVWCSKSWMNRIWSWDHCFVAIGMAPAFPELSWQQFRLFCDMQDPASGMLADWLSNVRRSWLCTKPPVHGWALGHLLRTLPISRQQLEEVYEPLRKWTNFWLTERNLDGDGLPCILNANESFDNTTANTLFGPVKAPEIAAYLVLQLEVLAGVSRQLGHETDSQKWIAAARSLLNTLIRVLWDPQAGKFKARRVKDGKTGGGDCIFSYVPLMLGRRLPDRIVRDITSTITEPGRFLTPYGVATESLASPRYSGDSYVKGPVWAPPNIFISEGLDATGSHALASRIRQSFLKACVDQGMSEHFDAKTGLAQGDPGYNWTAATFLHFARVEKL